MKKKILVVDDEFFITRSLSFMFGKEGYECRVAHDGAEALEHIANDKPDMVFLDIDMPVKDGIETAGEIRANPEWQDIRIVMLTAKGQEIDEKKARQLGVEEYFLKPFDPRAILNAVREMIGD